MVVADSRSPRDGSFLKIIGHYNPLTDPATLVVKEEEAIHWLEKGAKPSETAAKLLTRIGVMERAGRAPVRFEGKTVPPAEKKAAKAVPEHAPAPAAATAEAEPEVPEEPVPEASAEAADQTSANDADSEKGEPEAKEDEAGA
jgi:small subunit ribosomal protein S16